MGAIEELKTDLLDEDAAEQQRLWERNSQIVRLRDAGLKFSEIGAAVGVSVAWANSQYHVHLSRLRKGKKSPLEQALDPLPAVKEMALFSSPANVVLSRSNTQKTFESQIRVATEGLRRKIRSLTAVVEDYASRISSLRERNRQLEDRLKSERQSARETIARYKRLDERETELFTKRVHQLHEENCRLGAELARLRQDKSDTVVQPPQKTEGII